MAIITINANKTNTFSSVDLDSKTVTQKATIQGTAISSPIEGKSNIIANYEGRGYTFDGEADCTLYFKKYEVTCDYDSKATEINGYLDNGYIISGEVDCTVTLTKDANPDVLIVLTSTSELVEEIEVSGELISEGGDQVIVEGTPVVTEDEQVLLDQGFVYEGVIDSKKTWSREISYTEYDNRLKTIYDYESKGYTFLGEEDGALKFSGQFEKCEVKDKTKVIAQHEADGFSLVDEQECRLHFQKDIESISNETDIYAFFDTTSMMISDGAAAEAALDGWYNSYKTANPDYKGNLYILPIYYERYVDYLDIVKKGNAVGKDISGNTSNKNAASIRTGWSDIANFPPNFDYITTNTVNTSWTPPTDVLMLAFVDEAQGNGYHGSTLDFTDQPNAYYQEDHARFLTNIQDFQFFKSVLYPIVRMNNSTSRALILQSLAAIEGKILTQSEIDDTDTLVDVSAILTQNPYSSLKPLKELGWVGVYDKVSPASEVFNSTQFSTELNTIIKSGVTTDTQKENKYVDGITTFEIDEVAIKSVLKTKKEYAYQEGCEVKIGDPEYFQDASFTIAYSPTMGAWISYYSFVPNYYVNHNDFFQTGLNEGVGGLWSHLLTNKSFQSFYGETFPWIMEVPVKEQFVNRTLKDVEFYMDAKEYSGDYDYAEVRNRGFNKAWIYNNRVNTGELNLKPSTGLMSDLSKYPNTLSQTQQEIPYSDLKGKHRFNYFFDRVKDDRSSLPMWKWDTNQIGKELNPEAISFTGKSTLDQIKGDWFTVRFQQDERTDTRFEFKWLTTSETIKP